MSLTEPSTAKKSSPAPSRAVPTGISGLDDVLAGGFPEHRMTLLMGDPGTGKTTLALQFLLEGARRGERGLYVTLSETREELVEVAASHGWTLEGFEVMEISSGPGTLRAEEQYTMFHPAEVELGETTQAVLDRVEAVRPTRMVFDSLSEMRLLARDSLRFRRQILALKHFFVGRDCTVLLLDDGTGSSGDLHPQTVSHGVIELEHIAADYGSDRRRMRVVKLRGVRFRSGHHDMAIKTGGIEVFPRLIASEHMDGQPGGFVPSGLPELDHLLGGGAQFGTSALLTGPAGSGKSSLVAQFLSACAANGYPGSLYVFDEALHTSYMRSASLGIPLREQVDGGKLHVRQVDPADLAPGQFVHEVRRCVEEDGVRVVAIDSLNGYVNAMPDARHLLIQLHELLVFLNQKGVFTMLTIAHHGLVGANMVAPIDASYLADTVILLRYFEAEGEVRQAISVIKKRSGPHERTIREFRLGPGIRLGRPLLEFHGVLTGVPTYTGRQTPLLARDQKEME